MAPDVITRRMSAHRQALRAVGRVAFTLSAMSAMGCLQGAPGGDDATPGDDESDGAFDATLAAPEPEPEPEADAGFDRDALIDWVAEDAQVDVEFDAAAIDEESDGIVDASGDGSDAIADGGEDTRAPCPTAGEDPEAWVKCCEAINWDFNRDPNCAAWGPPVPPAMPSPEVV